MTASDATPFLGDWTLAMDGPNGSATFALSVKVEKDQVVGELSSDRQPRQPIMDVSKRGTSLVLDYQGMAVPVIITLTPAADKPAEKMNAHFDYASGGYETGTATKKEKAK